LRPRPPHRNRTVLLAVGWSDATEKNRPEGKERGTGARLELEARRGTAPRTRRNDSTQGNGRKRPRGGRRRETAGLHPERHLLPSSRRGGGEKKSIFRRKAAHRPPGTKTTPAGTSDEPEAAEFSPVYSTRRKKRGDRVRKACSLSRPGEKTTTYY